ncbi:MAG: ferritin family protein [Leptonema sp. (in: Bacteria)]|nr:ferritin family protein [Leptonema sp. (in: bacteria)]
MSNFKPVKKTTFLEAVAACIEHEKKVFEFYIRNADSLPEGPIKTLFYDLAEDQDEHIKMIADLYSSVNGGQALPNLKMASQVQKFNSTSLQILMRRLDRITERDAGGVEIDALALATKQHEDTSEFYGKMAEKFTSPDIRYLFKQLSNFQEESRLLLESFSTYKAQGTPYSQPAGYWDLEN